MKSWCDLSADGKHLYARHRVWDPDLPRLGAVLRWCGRRRPDHDGLMVRWLMVRACRFGFGSLSVFYAFTARIPRLYLRQPGGVFVGPEWNKIVSSGVSRCREVLCGWGRKAGPRRTAVLATLLSSPAAARLTAVAIGTGGDPAFSISDWDAPSRPYYG